MKGTYVLLFSALYLTPQHHKNQEKGLFMQINDVLLLLDKKTTKQNKVYLSRILKRAFGC